jgi:hypothetical protein
MPDLNAGSVEALCASSKEQPVRWASKSRVKGGEEKLP